ncbi:hypothetical protein CS063_03140 [Sporanaerobium hydrogeniformans]|uniref:Uncharacterized protein n=2 Tax=Sporanaerobium hydrogeniformans TaxID=3072179 RepID=A0AC61DFB8_9FIRM|nr:hypothetical protein CS063_03140 [Sporanaerobium hydrogeniformans]
MLLETNAVLAKEKNSGGNYIYASSHYIIGNDGTIIRCIPEKEVAYHAGKVNGYSIGIELCHMDNTGKPTQKAYDLTSHFLKERCLPHYEVRAKAIQPK